MIDLVQSFLGSSVPVEQCALVTCVLFIVFFLYFVETLRGLFRVR